MVKYEWNLENVPDDIEVRQVYGIVFNDVEEIFLREDEGKYKLTGGRPEKFDKTFEDTLKREYLEEVNISLKEVYYLGYLLVHEGEEYYAQVRMIARIDKVGEARPDSDTSKIYGRRFVLVEEANTYLNYKDEAGKKMLNDAIIMAKEKYRF